MQKPKDTPIGYMFDCVLDSIEVGNDGHTFIKLKTHSSVNEDMFELLNVPLHCSIKRQKSKRSYDANSYCWELCRQIAERTQVSSMDIYRQSVREFGVYKDYVVDIDKINDIKEAWSKFGIGWLTDTVDFADDDKVILRCYYGTSTYDSKQMSTIINYLVNEATELGITTLSARKRNEILNEWRKEEENSNE